MQKIGKILFFNESDGKGILITSQREKINFNIQDWDDFDAMPSLGLEVIFTFEDDKALNIISNASTTPSVINAAPEIKKNNDNNDSDKINTTAHNNKQPSSKNKNFSLQEDEQEITNLLEKAEDNLKLLHGNIKLTVNISDTMNQYFARIKKHINLRIGYKKVDGRLNYLLARRFIWTTFNNLTEIDSNIITLRIKSISDDLKSMGDIYDDFTRKTRYPSIAFEEVFLSCQTEYKKVKKNTDETIEKLNLLRSKEKVIGFQRKLKNEEINKNKDKAMVETLINQLKSLNGAYVDVIHTMAELSERHKHNLKLLQNFEKAYKKDFYENFLKESLTYKMDMLEILDSQAYLVDYQLWQEAKASKTIQEYFKRSLIDGNLNTKTYLKYYLDTLDSQKVNEHTKELYELYEHLLDVQKEYILIVARSVQEAMEYEAAIKSSNSANHVKSFIDEISAIKWAMKNYIKLLIIEDLLQTTNAERFLSSYHNNILARPKIILLGDKPKINSSEYTISKILSKNISPKVLATHVNELLNS